MEIEFDQSLQTGIPLIDAQHMEYFRRLNILVEKISQSTLDLDEIKKCLEFLTTYAVEHLDAEEYLMEQSSYPQLDQHFDRHEYFRESIDDMSRKMQAEGISDNYIKTLLSLLSDWFQGHIKTYDMKLAEYLKSQKNN